jgi:hypothetical protein
MGAFTRQEIASRIRSFPAKLASLLAALVPVDRAEFTNPPGASSVALKAATATVAAPVTLGPSDLLTQGKADIALYPRRIRFATAGVTPADAPATATVVGKDVDGNTISETINLAQTATTADTTKFFASITSISYPAADGTGATVSIGYSPALGLPFMPKLVTGAVVPVREIMDGAPVATAGTFVAPAAGAPYGGYTPNTAADGGHDYALYLEREVA